MPWGSAATGAGAWPCAASDPFPRRDALQRSDSQGMGNVRECTHAVKCTRARNLPQCEADVTPGEEKAGGRDGRDAAAGGLCTR